MPITESLLKLDPALNRVAVECFECIMRYMGDLPTTPELNEVKCVYTILMVGRIVTRCACARVVGRSVMVLDGDSIVL